MSIPSAYFRPDLDLARLAAERRSLVENLLLTMRTYARISPQGAIWEGPGVLGVYSGRPGAIFNSVLLTEAVQSEAQLVQHFEWAQERYAAQGARWSLWLAEHFVPSSLLRRTERILQRYKLAAQHRSVGMLANALVQPQRQLPALDYKRILEPATRFDFCFVMSQAFTTALKTYLDAYQQAAYWEGPLRGLVAYDGGQAVSSACYAVSRDAVGLYGVATLPERQRNGFGERIVRRALEEAEAETGLTRFVLEASELAAPLYRRLGFRPITHVTVYNEVC